ncbi:MAG: Na/Pi cotransporter family protein [Proteobacteria bacterium]|nr:Na/Pi cotransporter family protein [Pseudomonadota bacterium]MBU1388701.1 Na/Pi cotransporter family protein [Pseudomonadota bacterium]MBU1541911.1 Na/Pi cotransporter family protein [Pseudomonadota bacterium]MBU2480863.1 Na/Pi cotransporter family protein [Pseudomonadota bacterium]
MNISGIIMQTLGGLGLFILGMKMMTEGLQATAGQKIKRILEAISSNRFMGCATGAGVTAMVQSSSATTVMLIGFVSAGIMTIEQAVGVVIGANIGTTITGQMIAFNLTAIALPAVAVGVALKYFSKKRNFRHIGEIILGFGLLFYGMTVMKHGLSPIKSDPQFIAFFTTFSTETMAGILLCVFMGTVLTVAVQSSSATVGLTMTLAASGLLTYPTALALVLGENIGTTVTAQLSTLGSNNADAHRTANAHTIFNVIGVGFILLIFPWFVDVVEILTLKMGAGPVLHTVNGEFVNVSRYIANGHTVFNVVNAVVFLIFLPKLVQLTILLSPKPSKSKERYELPQFDASFIDSPIGALAKVKGEIIKNAQFAYMNLKKISTCLKKRDDDIFGERQAVEEHLDELQKVIIRYLTTIYQGEVNESQAREISELMRITNNIERLGDSMENVSKILERIYENNFELSEQAKADLIAISDQVDYFFGLIIDQLHENQEGFYQKALACEDKIDQMRENMRYQHIERLRAGDCSVDVGVFFISLVSNYEKMGDYCFNIATGVDRIS